jgi:hypothetical protein
VGLEEVDVRSAMLPHAQCLCSEVNWNSYGV